MQVVSIAAKMGGFAAKKGQRHRKWAAGARRRLFFRLAGHDGAKVIYNDILEEDKTEHHEEDIDCRRRFGIRNHEVLNLTLD